jgi:membrane protease YdiL (CAAX protease family)
MNPESPVIAKPPSSRRFFAPSLRCRRRKFGRPLTIFLTLLTGLTLALFCLYEDKGYEQQYAFSCEEAMDDTLLVMLRWEKSGDIARTLTGYFSTEQFFTDLVRRATDAENDGYLSDGIRLRMVMICVLFERPHDAGKWMADITDENALRLSRLAISQGVTVRFLERLHSAARKDAGSEGRTAFAAGMFAFRDSAPNLAAASARAYDEFFRLNLFLLCMLLAGIPSLWWLRRLLFTGDPAVINHRSVLETRWTPEITWAAWVRAEWVFLFSGILIHVGYSLAGIMEESPDLQKRFPSLHRVAAWYNQGMQELSGSLLSNVVWVILFIGPALLMVRWLTPGMHGTLRLFGIRRSPLKGRILARAILAGVALSALLDIIWIGVDTVWHTGDPRDGWSRVSGPLWEQILYGCAVAPFAEGFLFRGFLFTAFKTRWKTPAAALVSSFLFALVHGYSLDGTIWVFCFGLLMCWLYHRTGTLLVPLAVHAVVNGWAHLCY